jgi:hypothetical protein
MAVVGERAMRFAARDVGVPAGCFADARIGDAHDTSKSRTGTAFAIDRNHRPPTFLVSGGSWASSPRFTVTPRTGEL